MASMEVKSFDSPDEVREFEGNGHADVLQLGGHTVGRGTFDISLQGQSRKTTWSLPELS